MRSITVWIGAIVFTIGAGVFLIEREYLAGDKIARVRLEQGKLQLERFDEDGLRKGIDELTAVVANFPESVYAREARYHLAEAYERLGMRDVALGKYKRLAEMPLGDELKSRVRFKIAKLQIMRNYSDEGMNQLVSLLNSTHDKALRSEIYLEIGKYYQRKGLTKDARRNYENALAENPENREARAALGLTDADYTNSVALHGILDKHVAAQEVKQAEAGQKYDLAAGISAFTRGEYERAIGLLLPAAKSGAPESEEALYYVGNAYLKQKDYRKAVHYLNQAVGNSYRGRDEASYIKKGEAYYLDNRLERAAHVFRFVRTHYPHGKYAQIAADWENETRRLLGDKNGGKEGGTSQSDEESEDDAVLGSIAAGDEAAPRPKKTGKPDKADPGEDLTLDEAEVTP